MDLPALRSAVATLTNLPDAKELRDKAAAIEVYARQAKLAGGIERQAATIRVRAERRIGQLLRAAVKRGKPNGRTERPLAKLGITKTQSSRWQLLARLPEPAFERALAKTPSTATLVKLAQQHLRSKPATGPDAGGHVFTCDALDLDCPPVDLVLSDLPYGDLPAYSKLGQFAAERLKPGGLCLAYCGQIRLPEVMAALGERLDYWWTFAVQFGGKHNAIYARHIQATWKPIVAFAKGKPKHEWLRDMLTGTTDKTLHIWQQPQSEAEYLIEKLTEPGDLVCDPFCGSGTVLAAARKLGRQWIGCDSDANAARVSRRRLAA